MTNSRYGLPRWLAGRARQLVRHLRRNGDRAGRAAMTSAIERAIAADRADVSHKLLCERLEPRYLLSADILPLSSDHPDALDLTLDYDAAADVLHLIDNDRLDAQGAPMLLAALDAPGPDTTLTIAYDPSYGDNGALIVGEEANVGDGARVEIITGSGDDSVTLKGFDYERLGFSYDGGAGNDRLTVEHAGDSTQALLHELTGPRHGVLTTAAGSVSHTYVAVEQVELGTVADSHTITPTKGANVTLNQDADGNLIAAIQHAFDADTDLSALDGTDGFAAAGASAGDAAGYSVARAGRSFMPCTSFSRISAEVRTLIT